MNGEILPPEKSGNGDQSEESGNSHGHSNHVNIGQFHYHGNDLKELGRIAETNPALAQLIIENADRQDQRWHASERLGLITTAIMLILVLGFILTLVLNVGLWSSIAALGLLLACGVLIRVILTGEWSETSWVGTIMNGLARGLGARGPNPSED